MNLNNKVALVTGGSKGIGRAISIKLASLGAKVVINQEGSRLSRQQANEVCDFIKGFNAEAMVIDADVSKKKQVQEMINQTIQNFGKLDILVANAGICPFSTFDKIDENLLSKVIDVNQKGSFYCAQLAAQEMIQKKIAGRIIFTSSISAVFGGELQIHYCGTKGAINQMMKSFAIALGKHKITVNAVQPGTVITDINRKELQEDPELLNYFIKRTPLNRLAEPEDIANAIAFYASDESACITGTTLTVDGGMSVNFQ